MTEAATNEQIMIQRMASGEPFSYGDLYRLPDLHPDPNVDRVADKLIQKWRRAERISFTRLNRSIYWSLTEIGRQYVADMGASHD